MYCTVIQLTNTHLITISHCGKGEQLSSQTEHFPTIQYIGIAAYQLVTLIGQLLIQQPTKYVKANKC